MAGNGTLSAKQRKAISALLTTSTVKRAAKIAHISQRQLFRWLNEAAFKSALDQAADDCIAETVRMLADASGTAVLTLRTALTDPSAGANVKVRAADVILDKVLKLKELSELQERIAKLEDVVNAERHR